MSYPPDRSVVDALSWRLGSELLRHHPHDLRLNRGHPGDGLYDCLMISSASGPANVMLNREGTIQVDGRFDGKASSEWRPTSWEEYFRADPSSFLLALESSAGLPPHSPASTTRPVLVYRIFAALSGLVGKTTRPYEFEQAYIDSAGDDSGPNDAINAFPAAAAELTKARNLQPREEAGLDYWMVFQQGQPRWAFERNSARVWTRGGGEPADLMEIYCKSQRDINQPTFALLRSLSTM